MLEPLADHHQVPARMPSSHQLNGMLPPLSVIWSTSLSSAHLNVLCPPVMLFTSRHSAHCALQLSPVFPVSLLANLVTPGAGLKESTLDRVLFLLQGMGTRDFCPWSPIGPPGRSRAQPLSFWMPPATHMEAASTDPYLPWLWPASWSWTHTIIAAWDKSLLQNYHIGMTLGSRALWCLRVPWLHQRQLCLLGHLLEKDNPHYWP